MNPRLVKIDLNFVMFQGANAEDIQLHYDPVQKLWCGNITLANAWCLDLDQAKVDLLVSLLTEEQACVAYGNPVPVDTSTWAIGRWLDEVSVMEPGMWGNTEGPTEWYAVCDHEGIVAYFGNEIDAFRFRLDYINRKLNQ